MIRPAQGFLSVRNAAFRAAARVRFWLLPALAMVFSAVVVSASAWAAPEPDPVPRRWQLNLKLGELRLAKVEVDGLISTYFFLTYRVTNTSGQDLLLAPSFELATDEGEVLRSGRDVPTAVTRRILELVNDPLVEDQLSILGMILQGEENAKDGVVIWPATDLDINEIAVYASGFSGETETVQLLDRATGQNVPYLHRKTLMARYRMPGELFRRGTEPFEPYEQRWIMR